MRLHCNATRSYNVFGLLDADEDGYITHAEFMVEANNVATEEQFKIEDADGDGRISCVCFGFRPWPLLDTVVIGHSSDGQNPPRWLRSREMGLTTSVACLRRKTIATTVHGCPASCRVAL